MVVVPEGVVVVFDEEVDTLYVRFLGARSNDYRETENDYEVILGMGHLGMAVAVTFLGVSVIGMERWMENKDRHLIPKPLLDVIDQYVEGRHIEAKVVPEVFHVRPEIREYNMALATADVSEPEEPPKKRSKRSRKKS